MEAANEVSVDAAAVLALSELDIMSKEEHQNSFSQCEEKV